MLIEKYEMKRIAGGCEDDGSSVSIQATVPEDISAVYPYVNTQVPGCAYNRAGHTINWGEDKHKIVLRAQELSISNLPDWQTAKDAGKARKERATLVMPRFRPLRESVGVAWPVPFRIFTVLGQTHTSSVNR